MVFDYYNNHSYNESLKNFTPADVYFGININIERKRRKTKWRAIRQRKKTNLLTVF